MTQFICGVDVSSETLDVCIGRDGPVERFPRTAKGSEALVAFCKDHGATLMVLEATGGYERLPFTLAWQAGLPAAVVNPRSVRRFAEAMGLLEKTDAIDAGVIAWYAEVKRIVAQRPASEIQLRLQALVTRLRQLTSLRTIQTNQRRLVDDPEVVASFDDVMLLLNRQIRSFERNIAELIDSDPLWAKLDAEFRTVKGVADRTVARLMAELPEIGTISGKAASKLVGVAPLANDSGKRQGKRSVRGGRANLRSILFLVADIARKYDPDLAAFHKRLVDKGLAKKAIRIALARKLLVRLNAKARDVRSMLACPA